MKNFTSQAYNRAENVLSDVTMQARAGEVTVVLGHKGSGKSTLIASVLGNSSFIFIFSLRIIEFTLKNKLMKNFNIFPEKILLLIN